MAAKKPLPLWQGSWPAKEEGFLAAPRPLPPLPSTPTPPHTHTNTHDFASHSGLLQPMDFSRDVCEPRHGVSIWGALDAHGPAATEPARRPRSFANVSVLELRNPGLRHSHSGFRFQIFRFQIPDFRFQISDFRSRISDFRFILSDFRYQISDFEFQFSDPKPSRCTDPADFLISDFFFQISSFFFPAAGEKTARSWVRPP